MKSGLASGLAWTVLLALTTSVASPAAQRDPLAGLQAWLDGTRDLRCRFEQRLVSSALGSGTAESGRLHLRRPGRMRWDYERPEVKTAIIDGERTLLYLAEDRQLIRGTLDPDQSLLPALLAGSRRLTDLFRVSSAAAADGVSLRLTPRTNPEGVREIVITVDGRNYAILRAEVLDSAGNRIEYRFASIRRNAGVPETTFTFEPPPGTEIIDEPPARDDSRF